MFSTFIAAHSPLSHQAAFVCVLTFWCKSSFGAFQLGFVKDAGAASKGDLNGQALISLVKK